MSGDLKFDKEETSVAVDLKGLEENLTAAIDEAVQDSAATGSRFTAPSSEADVAVDAVAMKAVSPVVGVALTAQEHARGAESSGFFMGERQGGNKANRRHGSIFVGEAPSQQQKMTNAMGLPMSYGEKKTAVKQANRAAFDESRGKGKGGGRDLMGDVNAAGAALTGQSAGHAKAFTGRGLKLDPHVAAQLGLVPQALVDTLDSVRTAQNGPMSAARLQEGLGRGDDGSEQFIKNNPALAEQIFKHADVKPVNLRPPKTGN